MTGLYTTAGVAARIWDTSGNPVLGTGESDPPAPTGPDVSAMTVRRQIAPNTALQVGGFYPSTGAAQTYELGHRVTVDATSLVASVDASVAGGSLTLSVAGTTHRATFGGATKFSKSGDAKPVFSDPVAVTVRAGDTVTARLYLEATTVQHRAAKALGVNPARWGEGDLTATGVGISEKSNTQKYLPTVVSLSGMTYPATVSVLGIGDSIFESGSGNPTGYTLGVQQAGHAFLNAGRWGGSTIGTGDVGLTGLPANFTHVLDEYAFNDLTNEAVAKTMADKIATWAWLHAQNPALKITACTVTPYPSSTDGWTTLAGQTPGVGTVYDGLNRHQRAVVYNDWIRDGAPILNGIAAPGATDPAAKRAGQAGHPLAGWIEIADTVESSRNSGIFRVDKGSLTADGAHMNSVAGDLISVPVRAWAATLKV